MTVPAPAGIDIGGTGIKAALVDVEHGQLLGERIRVATPQPATPAAVAGVVARVVDQLGATTGLGITMPAVVVRGVVMTAANIDKSWIGTDAAALFFKATGRAVGVVNDADAAGVAEMRHGAGKGQGGVVVLVTLGTGIGSALFFDGVLVPNTELGHLRIHGEDAEAWAAESARERDDLSWKRWAHHLSDYLEALEALVWPERFIIGGGVSRQSDKFVPHLTCRTPVVPALLHNDAGIVGAAMFAPAA